jgi:hypothetical protein
MEKNGKPFSAWADFSTAKLKDRFLNLGNAIIRYEFTIFNRAKKVLANAFR